MTALGLEVRPLEKAQTCPIVVLLPKTSAIDVSIESILKPLSKKLAWRVCNSASWVKYVLPQFVPQSLMYTMFFFKSELSMNRLASQVLPATVKLLGDVYCRFAGTGNTKLNVAMSFEFPIKRIATVLPLLSMSDTAAFDNRSLQQSTRLVTRTLDTATSSNRSTSHHAPRKKCKQVVREFNKWQCNYKSFQYLPASDKVCEKVPVSLFTASDAV